MKKNQVDNTLIKLVLTFNEETFDFSPFTILDDWLDKSFLNWIVTERAIENMDPELLNDDDIDNEDILLKAEKGLTVPNTKVNSENNEEPKPLNVEELTTEQEKTSTYYIIYLFLIYKN